MKFDLIVPTRGNISNIENIFKSINIQSKLPENIFLIVDKFLSKSEFDEIFYFFTRNLSAEIIGLITVISNLNSDFTPERGVSRVRNYGIKLSKSKYLYFIDDDNQFEKDFFQKTISQYKKFKKQINNEILFSPLINYRRTNVIQSSGIKGFNIFFSKVCLNKSIKNEFSSVKMVGGNSLFGLKKIFENNKFDERFKFVYEDLDFTYRVYLSGYPIVVSNLLKIFHMERDKTKLEYSFIGDESSAFQKSQNRLLFVRKNYESWQYYLYICSGLWIQTLRFILLIFIYGNNKISLIKKIFLGTFSGFKIKL